MDLRHLAVPGTEIAVRATPRAARDAVTVAGDLVRIRVTAVPEKGKANAAAAGLLAEALGVLKSLLTLLRGAASRDKTFRIE